jgi:hypothetical protein
MVHAYNPSYMGCSSTRVIVWANLRLWGPYLKNKLKAKGDRGMAQMIEHLPSKCNGLSSNSSTVKTKRLPITLCVGNPFQTPRSTVCCVNSQRQVSDKPDYQATAWRVMANPTEWKRTVVGPLLCMLGGCGPWKPWYLILYPATLLYSFITLAAFLWTLWGFHIQDHVICK